MSEAVFPGDLPGIKWDRARSVGFKTGVYEALSGAERRIRYRTVAKRRLELSYEVLREKGGLTELQRLLSFFKARQGAFDSFLLHDPYDGQVTNYQFGTGNGSQVDFQLTRSVGGLVEVVHNPEAGLAIGRVWFPNIGEDATYWPQPFGEWPDAFDEAPVGGGHTLLANGIVRFNTAPPAGKALLWTGRFFYRARFADDVFDYKEFLHRLFSIGKLSMVMSLQNIL